MLPPRFGHVHQQIEALMAPFDLDASSLLRGVAESAGFGDVAQFETPVDVV